VLAQLRSALAVLIALTLVTGVAYPLLVTGVAQAAFPRQAAGSLAYRGGKAVGSRLIGQSFDDARYFWGRLSATVGADGKPRPYNGAASAGSNLGPTNPALAEEAKARIDALRAADPGDETPVPVDLVTSSGSGLDPDISPAAALYQVARVARARNVDPSRVRALVEKQITGRELGLFGDPRVNVLELNIALDDATASSDGVAREP
jgi:K+-transporting ATPase ATPase C chain